MISIDLFRDTPETIEKSQKKRGLETSIVDNVLKVDKKWRKTLQKLEKLRQKRNEANRKIAEAKKKGKTGKKEIKEMRKIADTIEKLEEKANKFLEERDNLRKSIPNLLDNDVPKGKDESDNVELRRWGKIPKFKFEPKGHADLVEEFGLVNTEKASSVSGSRFYYLKDELVLLNLALQKFALDILSEKGFVMVQTPYMLNRGALDGSVSLTDFEESIYKIEDENLYLIGTSEHALAAMYKDDLINVDKPLKYVGLSSCFRKEAGSHGKDTKGIFRVHRFEKIEQFVFCNSKDEEKIFNELIQNQEEIFKKLKLPYRIVVLCSGDTGGSMAKTYDLEGWFPAQNKYRELGSTSTAKTYQAIKQNIKFLNEKNEKEYVYTLNGTAMSVQRTICCILENYQNKKGEIEIPKALRPYMNNIKKIKPIKNEK